VHRTLPAELTGEQALTLFLAAHASESLTPFELDAAIPRLQYLASLMVSRQAAAPAPTDVDPPTMPIAVRPLDPPTLRLRPVMVTARRPITQAQADEMRAAIERGPGEHDVPGGVISISARKPRPVRAAVARILLTAAVLGALLVGAFVVTATSPLPPSPTADVPPAAPVGPVPQAPFAGSHTYTAGAYGEIQSGTYTSEGAADPRGVCYWARLSDQDGRPGSIVPGPDGDGAGTGRQTVTIEPSDRAFSSRGCATWNPS
jgi:hypothetical protein